MSLGAKGLKYKPVHITFHKAKVFSSTGGPYLVGTAALAEYMEPSAGHLEEPCPGAPPSCTGAYEMAVLVAVGIHSELPLVSDSSESGHFHPTDHWKGGEASECFAGLQTHKYDRYSPTRTDILHLHCALLLPHAQVMALSNTFLRSTLCSLTGK